MGLTPHRAWVDVDLGALVANARTVARASHARLLPMVKANAYGLGAVPVVRALEQTDPWGYGVATVEEAAELRAAGVTRPLIVFTPLTVRGVERHQALDARPMIGDLESLAAWTSASDRPFHVDIDTGIGRAGFRYDAPDVLDALRQALAGAAGWEGIMTHFHSPDEVPASVPLQWDRFLGVLGRLGARPPLIHAAGSGAIFLGTGYAGDLVRPGLFLYGGRAHTLAPPPEPVVAFRAEVVALRTVLAGESVGYGATWTADQPTAIATLACGYADGVRRSLGNRGHVELPAGLAPIVGRVSMDLTTVAVPGNGVKVGDVATVFGGAISLEQQATAAGTIAYELLTGIGSRVERRYREA